jgi:hypothetical protein
MSLGSLGRPGRLGWVGSDVCRAEPTDRRLSPNALIMRALQSGTTTADRAEPNDLRDETALAERLAALDAALARQDVSRAIYEWRDAYGLALRSRGWDTMAAVADAAVRVDAAMGGPADHPAGFRVEARRAYFHALLRAQRDRSREGVNQIADAFEALGDAGIAAKARTIGAER